MDKFNSPGIYFSENDLTSGQTIRVDRRGVGRTTFTQIYPTVVVTPPINNISSNNYVEDDYIDDYFE
jgi:hypothetical protein